jgi:hypothetical protein
LKVEFDLGSGNDTEMNGGVTSLMRTSSQRPWIKAGRRQKRLKVPTTAASTIAATALLSMVWTSDSMKGRSPFGAAD